MARSQDPDLRVQLLGKVIDYVRGNGVAELSLRPLAAAVGSSPRTLLYHFGSREELLCAVFDTLREIGLREAELTLTDAPDAATAFRSLWSWLADPARRPTLRLFYEMYGISVSHPDRFGDYARRVARLWLEMTERRLIEGGCSAARAPAVASAIVAMYRGASLELAATDDAERLGDMIDEFLSGLPFGGFAS